MQKILFLFWLITFSGCSTVQLMDYGVPVDATPIKPDKAEFIFRKGHVGDNYVDRSSVIQIGEKKFLNTFLRENYFLKPGEYEITMNYFYLSEMMSAGTYDTITAFLEAGHRYYTDHFRDGDFVEIWLVDALTGEVPGSRFKKELSWYELPPH